MGESPIMPLQSRHVHVVCALAVLGSTSPALAATPSPAPGVAPTPLCRVVPDPKPTNRPPARKPHPHPTTLDTSTVAVYIPRVVCTGPVKPSPHPGTAPTKHPVRGSTGGAASGPHGQVPFTGAEAVRWLVLGLAAVVAGTALQALARRRRRP